MQAGQAIAKVFTIQSPTAPGVFGVVGRTRETACRTGFSRSGTDWAAIEASGDLSIERGFEIVLE